MRSGVLSNLNATYSSCFQRVVVGKGSFNRRSPSTSLSKRLDGHSSILKHSALAYGRSLSYNCSIGQYAKGSTVSSLCNSLWRNSAATSASVAVSGDVYVDKFFSRWGNVSAPAKPCFVFSDNKQPGQCQKASLRLGEVSGTTLGYGYFMSGKRWRSSDSRLIIGPWLMNSGRFASVHSAAHDVSLDLSSANEQLGDHRDSSEQAITGKETWSLISGSCYLPHPDKEETGGEDAHFICVEEHVIGIADGVGGWADVGVDAGEYARRLMSNSVVAIKEELKGSIDPAKVLEKAHSLTKARGSSTACIIALSNEVIHAINLGDSGFLITRDGSTIFRSPVQQYGFNFPHQLEDGNGGDLPSSGQVFKVPVATGDVIVAGTDGLFDNLYNNEICSIVVHGGRAHWEPQLMAQNIAALARERAMDRHRQTPFSAAAQDAGFRYYGGKLDDITVVVSYINSTSTL